MANKIVLRDNDGSVQVSYQEGSSVDDDAFLLLAATSAHLYCGGISKQQALDLFANAWDNSIDKIKTED